MSIVALVICIFFTSSVFFPVLRNIARSEWLNSSLIVDPVVLSCRSQSVADSETGCWLWKCRLIFAIEDYLWEFMDSLVVIGIPTLKTPQIIAWPYLLVGFVVILGVIEPNLLSCRITTLDIRLISRARFVQLQTTGQWMLCTKYPWLLSDSCPPYVLHQFSFQPVFRSLCFLKLCCVLLVSQVCFRAPRSERDRFHQNANRFLL